MRNATVLGGNVRLAAAMTASDTSSPAPRPRPKSTVHVRAQRQRIGSETAAASLKGCVAVHPVVPRRQPPRPVARADHSLGTAARRKKPPSVRAKRLATPLPRFRLRKTRPTRPLARVARKPQRIDFSTPPRQKSRSLRRSARPADARRQRERCSPAGPLPPPLRRKRPQSRPLIGRRLRRGRRSDENRFAARPPFR